MTHSRILFKLFNIIIQSGMDFVNLLVSLLIISIVHSQKLGDPCFHTTHSNNGICKSLSECPIAIQELSPQKQPQICNFEGTNPVVCCPEDVTPTTPTTTITAQPEIVGARSKQKCKEYAKHVFETRETLLSKNETINICGAKHVELIAGVTLAKGKEFPHMAAIGYDTDNNSRVYICGGSLISRNYVLTAGHCLNSRAYGVAKYVRVGDLQLDVNTDDAATQELNIIERIAHPDYKYSSHYNDIGLLKVERDFDISAYVRPICLNYEKNLPYDKAIVTGWGSTSYLGESSNSLLKVTLESFSHKQCKNFYKVNQRKLARGIDDNTQMCAGSTTERQDICHNSGGPLQIYHDNVYCMYKLVGITSFGKACGLSTAPGIYTRVSHYLPWIEKTVWP